MQLNAETSTAPTDANVDSAILDVIFDLRLMQESDGVNAAQKQAASQIAGAAEYLRRTGGASLAIRILNATVDAVR